MKKAMAAPSQIIERTLCHAKESGVMKVMTIGIPSARAGSVFTK